MEGIDINASVITMEMLNTTSLRVHGDSPVRVYRTSLCATELFEEPEVRRILDENEQLLFAGYGYNEVWAHPQRNSFQADQLAQAAAEVAMPEGL